MKYHDLTKPQGVRGRNSDNSRLREVLGWEPQIRLRDGLKVTYMWIERELRKAGRFAPVLAYAPTKFAELPRANVLGVGVHATTLEEAVTLSGCLLQSGAQGYVCLTGVHGVMEARRDPQLRHILNEASLCLPDGMPTVWLGRCAGTSAHGQGLRPGLHE